MKANKKQNHFPEEAHKIEQIPDKKNDGREGQDEAIKAKKSRKNRFLARLRKIWARVTGCMRCCTSIQDELLEPIGFYMKELQNPSGMYMEEFPEPSGIKIEDSKDILFTAKESAAMKEENLEENQSMKTDNEEAEVVVNSFEQKDIEAEYDLIHRLEDLYVHDFASQEAEVVKDSLVEKEIEEAKCQQHLEEEHQCLPDLMHSQEDLPFQFYNSQEELLSKYHHIPGQIEITEDLHIQDYDAEGGEEQEYKVEDDAEIKIKEDGEDGLEKADSTKEITGSSHVSSRDNESPTGKENKNNKGEDNSIGNETPSTVPLTLESFRFHQKLGEGGYSEVYLASDIIRKECVAIKAANKSMFREDEENFIEFNILKITHESPFLIHGRAAFHTEKCVHYVLELATRGDLYDFIVNNFPLDIPTIQFITAELICGIQFLHKKNILHRDLKPDNILITADGHIKITDFGLALMGVQERTTEEAQGTPPYMAPELVLDEEYGRGVDYFAIGVILYDMYTNQYPFPGEDVEEIFTSILEHTPHYPEFLTPDTVDILQALLCKNQHDRLGVTGDIRNHPFFYGINWDDVESRKMEPPAAIMMAEFVDLNMDKTLDYMEEQIDTNPEDQKIFKELSYICPDWSEHYHPVNNEAHQT